MTITWWTASVIVLHHRSIAYELPIYCSSLIYFSVAIVIITTKYQKYYFFYCYLWQPLPLLSYYFATKHFAADIKFPGVVELTTQLLILENILWLPLCRINKFGLNTLPSKTVAIHYTCGLSVTLTWSCTERVFPFCFDVKGTLLASFPQYLQVCFVPSIHLRYLG